MIGLLRRDLYSLRAMYGRNLVLVFVLYAVLSLAADITFLAYFVVWLMSFYTLSTVSLDENAGWDRYVGTLPVTTAQIVGARVLTAALMTALGAAFGLTLGVAACRLHGRDAGEVLLILPMVTGLALASIGLMLPAAYKWGVEKARNTFLMLFVVVCGGAALLRRSAGFARFLSRLEALLDAHARLLPLAALALGAAALLAGFAISCGIYRKKEF